MQEGVHITLLLLIHTATVVSVDAAKPVLCVTLTPEFAPPD